MAEIAFCNVTKRFGGTLAVDDVSFTVDTGEFFCIFGPPSSGKSTLLRLILGLDAPDEGEILIDGVVVNGVTPAARNVAMVFQNLALFPHMSARDNIRFPLVERRVPEARIAPRLASVVEKLHIAHILHKPPAQLSGGERQRVAIARALVRDPAAYLMDDPISALDARLREETRVELKRLQRDLGHTLIYVTHDQEEAMSVADRMAILDAGRVCQLGAPGEIYRRPANRYVAGLVGAPTMNILRCERGPDGRATAAGGAILIPDGLLPEAAQEIGIRPEDLRFGAPEDGEAVPARVFEVEPLGGFTVVTVEAGGGLLKALLRGQPRIAADETVTIGVAPGAIHAFAADGRALTA